jgi:hypothetical protein
MEPKRRLSEEINRAAVDFVNVTVRLKFAGPSLLAT